MPDQARHAVLDIPPPAQVAVGEGTSLFVFGWCFSPVERIRSLHLLLDGEPEAVMAHRMPRLDPFRELHPGLDPFAVLEPLLLSYTSGFWGWCGSDRKHRRADRTLWLQAELASGATGCTDLHRFRTVPALAAFRPLRKRSRPSWRSAGRRTSRPGTYRPARSTPSAPWDTATVVEPVCRTDPAHAGDDVLDVGRISVA